MTDIETPHPVDQLPAEPFEASAQLFADALPAYGYVAVDLTPGDQTRYRVIITQPLNVHVWDELGHRIVESADRIVTVSTSRVGNSYPWASNEIHWAYVLTQWALDEWTARVVARLLALVATKLGDGR